MFIAARFLLLLIGLTFLGTTSGDTASSVEPAGSDAYSAEQQDLIAFALDRFEQAGMRLPAVTIVFPDDPTRCHGYGGIYEPHVATVSICRPSDTTMVHELAHAWVESTLTPAARQDFMDLRGLDMWTGGSEWDQRGAEHAAEIVTWALMDRDISIRWVESDGHGEIIETRKLFKIPNSSREQLLSAFTRLTGRVAENRLADGRAGENPAVDVVSPEAMRAGG